MGGDGVNTAEIGIRIADAYRRNEPLWLEYDSGAVLVSGDDLLTAWDEYDLTDPFTILED